MGQDVIVSRSGTYAGRSAEARQAERRERLVTAAVEIWAQQGWAAVTMRGVCSGAGLTDRYFYESFTDRDALLVAVWDHLRDIVVGLVLAAIERHADRPPLDQLAAAIRVVVHATRDRPDHARILLGDNAGSALLEQRRRDTLGVFTDLLVDFARPVLRPGADVKGLRMSTLLGVGGFVELISAWRAGTVEATADEIVEHVAVVGADLAERYLRPSAL